MKGMLSLNTATTKKQWTLAQAIDGCARHGIRGISPWRDQVAQMGLKEAVKSINSHGLTVTGLCRGGFFTARNWRNDNLRAIEEALVRVKQGTHGVCVTYGLAISTVRLNAVPGRTTAANVRSSRGPDTQERAGHESLRSG